MTNQPDPFDDVVFDEEFVAGGAAEASADERLRRVRRIAAGNDRLRDAGEIADGSGKPRFHRVRRAVPWVVVGGVIAVAIVVVALIAR